jgi:nucleoside-diphosphate-sugar epimerase
MRTALMTGATGFVGRVFTRALLHEYPELEVWALVRGKDGAPPTQRPELGDLVGHPRFHVVEGDVTLAGLTSESRGDVRAIPGRLDACFHLAAKTDFKESRRSETFQANLEGTRNLVAFLQRLERPCRLFHVSTAYVAGVRPGETVREEVLGPAPRYCNPYEESKYAAELLVATSGLDWTIVRPSIIVGDSQSGAAESDKMIYGALKVLSRFQGMLVSKYGPSGMMAIPPGAFAVLGHEDVAKNLICVDDLIRLMLAVVRGGPRPGSVFHLVNPRTVSVRVLYSTMVELLGITCLRLAPSLPASLSEEEQALRHGIEVYEPYIFSQEPVFDTSRTRSLLGDAAVDHTLELDRERLRFLLGEHIRRRLDGSVNTPAPADGGPARARAAVAAR